MRKLNTSVVSNTVAMPIKSGTLEHLQFSYQEAITAIAKNILGRTNDVLNLYVLYGCINSGSGLNYVISAGAIYYAGEVYLVDAATFTAPGGQVAVGNIVVSQYGTNADPVTLTDGSTQNVHDIRKIVFAAAVSGTGIGDFSGLLQTPLALVKEIVADLGSGYTVKFDQDRAVYFQAATANATISWDFTNAVPGTVVRLKWAFGAARTLTINTPGGATIIRDSGNLGAVASANNLLYCLYTGKNESGNDEVSYTLKQY